MELWRLNLLSLLFLTAASIPKAVDSKNHLYKQIYRRKLPGSNPNQDLPLCSQGKKLSHPDPSNPSKYFLCQYVSKADMWLIHPKHCSSNQTFDFQTQTCVQNSYKAEPASTDNNGQVCEESIAKLSSAVAELSATVRVLMDKLIAQNETGNEVSQSIPILKKVVVPNVGADKASVFTKTNSDKNDNDSKNVVGTPLPLISPTKEIEDPGNSKESDEDEIVAEEKQEWDSKPITAAATNNTTNNPGFTPFVDFLFSNLLRPRPGYGNNIHPNSHFPFRRPLAPPSFPIPMPIQLKRLTTEQPLIAPSSTTKKPEMASIPVVVRPTPTTPPSDGQFVNLFSVLNFLTGGPSGSEEDISPFGIPIHTRLEPPSTPDESLLRKPMIPHSTVGGAVNADSSSEDGLGGDLLTNSTSAMLLSHSRKPRL